MKVAILLITSLFLFVSNVNGQAETVTYNWDYVMKYVRKHKMNTTNATNDIIDEIVKKHSGESQQLELIHFYSDAYNFKVVDKLLLKKVVDSLAIHGSTVNVKSTATTAIQLTEYRILGKRIRDFAFENNEGALVHLEAFRDKVVIIELWATWCAPCVEEMKKIPGLREKNSSIEFYSISLDSKPEKMQRFINKNKYQWPIVFGGNQDVNQDLWDYLDIVAIPKYYVINRDGLVIHVADKLDEEFVINLK